MKPNDILEQARMKSRMESQIKRVTETVIRDEINSALRQTRFSCNDRTCRYNALHYRYDPRFECTLKKVIVGVDNNGHWCDMYEKGKPEWSRLKDEE